MEIGAGLKLDVYINYPGHCAAAFRFYEQHLGGTIKMMRPHDQAPVHFPKEWKQPILHAIIEIGSMLVRGADIPGAEPMRSVYLTLRYDNAKQAEAAYKVLSAEGDVFVKLEENFFAHRFAMLRDKFGTSWMILQERAVEQ